MILDKADYRDKHAAIMRKQYAAGREVEIPALAPGADARRAHCRLNLPLFARTYFRRPPDAEKFPGVQGLCYLPLSPLHIEILKEFQGKILYGGVKAEAEPRGFGKDTLASVAAIWAALYGHSPFTVFACYELSSAVDRIATIKTQLEINSWLHRDFPFVTAPVRALDRAAQRAKQQTCGGEFTRIEWSVGQIILPTVKDSPASGSIISSGSVSSSIRGMNVNGRRPSFVIITDPQTREVARSQTQVKEIIKKINGDFAGLGAMDKPLSAIALVTVIARNDVADILTDPLVSPQWSGRRRKAIEAWPRRMDLWENYGELMEEGLKNGDTTGRAACRYYRANRRLMDEGAAVVWKQAFIKQKAPDGTALELSALQHFLNLRWRNGEAAFASEYQNEPEEMPGASGITAELVAGRLSQYPNHVAPVGMNRAVQFIDVGGRELHYVVVAYGLDGSNSVIDYGILEVDSERGGNKKEVADESRVALEQAVLACLRRRADETRAAVTQYLTADGAPLEIELSLVDSGWLSDSVYLFCRAAGPRWRPSKGDQVRPGSSRYAEPHKTAEGVRRGHHWYSRRLASGVWLWHLDADHWKLFTHERFLQDPATAGSCSIYGTEAREHRLFARHIVAEEWEPGAGRWVVLNKWNHFLDCMAGAHAAASMLGLRILPERAKQVIAAGYASRGTGTNDKSSWKIGR